MQYTQAQTTGSSRLRFWIRPVFTGNSAIDEKTEHQVSILADQYDAYFRYVKPLDCFEIVVNLNSSESFEKDTSRAGFELTLSFSDDRSYYRIFPAICIIPDSMVKVIENKLVTVVWSVQSKPIKNRNPFVRYASYVPYIAAGIKNDSFYCTIPVAEDSLSKQSAFPSLVEFTVSGNRPSCDSTQCPSNATIDKINTGRTSYYRIFPPTTGSRMCCDGNYNPYFHGYVSLPVTNEITHVEIVYPDNTKAKVPVKLRKIRTRLPEWRMVH